MSAFPFSSVTATDLQTIQLALQQQQQNLQQQLQNFLLLQSASNPQPSVLLQAQAQSIALQAASQQLQQLQCKQQQLQQQLQHQQQQQQQRMLEGTPRSSRLYPDEDDDAKDKLERMSLALSNLQPIPMKNFSRLEPTLKPTSKSTVTSSSSSSSSPPPTMLSPMPFTRISPLESSTNKCLELTPNENIDLEELEEFAKEFKQRRIKLGSLKLFNLLEKLCLYKLIATFSMNL